MGPFKSIEIKRKPILLFLGFYWVDVGNTYLKIFYHLRKPNWTNHLEYFKTSLYVPWLIDIGVSRLVLCHPLLQILSVPFSRCLSLYQKIYIFCGSWCRLLCCLNVKCFHFSIIVIYIYLFYTCNCVCYLLS